MSEKPILMSGPLVVKTIAGLKTQTRRVIRPQPEEVRIQGGDWLARDGQILRCPYGQPGDRLWVRETWAIPPGSTTPSDVAYRANHPAPDAVLWRPSIFMRREFSRLTLAVESIRVERLQSISEEDARAEGIERISSVGPCRAFGWRDYEGGAGFFDPRKSFRSLWDSINAARPGCSWAANPFVWCVAFSVAEVRR